MYDGSRDIEVLYIKLFIFLNTDVFYNSASGKIERSHGEECTLG